MNVNTRSQLRKFQIFVLLVGCLFFPSYLILSSSTRHLSDITPQESNVNKNILNSLDEFLLGAIRQQHTYAIANKPLPNVVKSPYTFPVKYKSPVQTRDVMQCRCRLQTISTKDETLKVMDTMIPWLNRTTMEDLLLTHPNFPVHMAIAMSKYGKCKLLPFHQSINWINTYWQEVELADKAKFLAYSATYDNRTATDIRPCVRILGMSMSVNITSLPYCQFWFNSTLAPSVSKSERIEYLDYQRKNKRRQMPYMISCSIPKDVIHLKPSAVSLVKEPCTGATNLLQVNGEGKRRPTAFKTKKDSGNTTSEEYTAAVCGTGLFYFHDDMSKRLVEWLEILKSKDISQVFLHEISVHPNIQKVLRHYEAEGFVSVTRYSYPSPYVNEPSMIKLWTRSKRGDMFAHENIYFTDCILRHMHQYRFIAHYDPDEIPVLLKYQSYTDFLNQYYQKALGDVTVNKSLPVAYRFHWKMFYSDLSVTNSSEGLPEYMYALRHTMRPKKDLPFGFGTSKTLYDMDFVTGVFSHNVLLCTSGICKSSTMKVSPKDAYLAHYTYKECGDSCKNKTSLVEDLNVVIDRKKIELAVREKLEKIGLL